SPHGRLPSQIPGDDLRFCHSGLKARRYLRSLRLLLKGELIPFTFLSLTSTQINGGARAEIAPDSLDGRIHFGMISIYGDYLDRSGRGEPLSDSNSHKRFSQMTRGDPSPGPRTLPRPCVLPTSATAATLTIRRHRRNAPPATKAIDNPDLSRSSA